MPAAFAAFARSIASILRAVPSGSAWAWKSIAPTRVCALAVDREAPIATATQAPRMMRWIGKGFLMVAEYMRGLVVKSLGIVGRALCDKGNRIQTAAAASTLVAANRSRT